MPAQRHFDIMVNLVSYCQLLNNEKTGENTRSIYFKRFDHICKLPRRNN